MQKINCLNLGQKDVYPVVYLFTVIFFSGRFYDDAVTSLREIPIYVTHNYHLKTLPRQRA